MVAGLFDFYSYLRCRGDYSGFGLSSFSHLENKWDNR